MSSKTILFLCSWYPNKKAPTLGNFVQRHANAIAQKHKVVVLFATSIKNQTEDFIIEKQFAENLSEYIVYYKKPTNKLIQLFWVFKALNYGYQEITKKHTIHFIHLNVIRPLGFFAFYLKTFKKLRYVITEHWTGFLPSNNYFEKLSFFEKSLIRVVGRNAEAIFPVSQDLGKNMGTKGIANTYYPIPNVVKEVDFFPEDESEDFFLHVSHLKQEHKNIFGILEAFKQVVKSQPHVKLIIVGDEEKEHVKNKISDLNLEDHIVLMGPLDSASIATLMKKALAFVLFSNYENLPCVLEEAQMCGCRIISTNVGGISEFFKSNNEDNILVEPHRIDDLAIAMIAFAKPENFDKKIARANKATQLFSVKAISENYNLAYKQLNL